MPANHHFALTKNTRFEPNGTLGFRIFYLEKLFGQSAAKLAMKPKSVGCGRGERRIVAAVIDRPLDLDMSHSLQLECALLRLGGSNPDAKVGRYRGDACYALRSGSSSSSSSNAQATPQLRQPRDG